MGIIKMHKNVPDIYTTSRDFQVLLNLQSLVFSGNKFDIDTIEDITSTKNIRSSLLSLLAQKVGFFTNYSFDDEELRQILIAFPYLLKNKGSIEAIRGAVNTFLHIKHLQIESDIEIRRKEDVDAYTVVISIESSFMDTTILEEIFRYILPVGWDYSVHFVKDFTKNVNATSYGEIEAPIDEVDEIVLTTYNSGDSYTYVPTAEIRSSQVESSYARDILLGAVDMGYVQGSDDSTPIYLLEGKPSYPITVNVIGASYTMTANTMGSGDTVTITFTPNANYQYSSSSVTGATATPYDTDTNQIVLSNPTQNVVVNVTFVTIPVAGNVSFSFTEQNVTMKTSFALYDGSDNTGTLLLYSDMSTPMPSSFSASCTSGHLYAIAIGSLGTPSLTVNTMGSTGITYTINQNACVFDVSANGIVLMTVNYSGS